MEANKPNGDNEQHQTENEVTLNEKRRDSVNIPGEPVIEAEMSGTEKGDFKVGNQNTSEERHKVSENSLDEGVVNADISGKGNGDRKMENKVTPNEKHEASDNTLDESVVEALPFDAKNGNPEMRNGDTPQEKRNVSEIAVGEGVAFVDLSGTKNGGNEVENKVSPNEKRKVSENTSDEGGAKVDPAIAEKATASVKFKRWIQIDGIPTHFLKGPFVDLRKTLEQVAVVGVIVRNNESANSILLRASYFIYELFLKNKKELESELNVPYLEINILPTKRKVKKTGDHTVSPTDEPSAHLTASAMEIFGNEGLLEEKIQKRLVKMEEEAYNSNSKKRIEQLCNDLKIVGQHVCLDVLPVNVFVFGSRSNGLAVHSSDVDVFLDIGHTFSGSKSQDHSAQQQTLSCVMGIMRKGRKVFPRQTFKEIHPIPHARVPIIRFLHGPTNLYCDLSFRSGLSYENSRLVRLYINCFDARVKQVVTAVKMWIKKNDIQQLNTYSVVWMVLYFLMDVKIGIVPPVLFLRDGVPSSACTSIEGWNTTFHLPAGREWVCENQDTVWELLQKFFEFYSNPKLMDVILCTTLGKPLPKDSFVRGHIQHEIFRLFWIRISRSTEYANKIFRDFKSLCLMDPFDLTHNLTKMINPSRFEQFASVCGETARLMRGEVTCQRLMEELTAREGIDKTNMGISNPLSSLRTPKNRKKKKKLWGDVVPKGKNNQAKNLGNPNGKKPAKNNEGSKNDIKKESDNNEKVAPIPPVLGQDLSDRNPAIEPNPPMTNQRQLIGTPYRPATPYEQRPMAQSAHPRFPQTLSESREFSEHGRMSTPRPLGSEMPTSQNNQRVPAHLNSRNGSQNVANALPLSGVIPQNGDRPLRFAVTRPVVPQNNRPPYLPNPFNQSYAYNGPLPGRQATLPRPRQNGAFIRYMPATRWIPPFSGRYHMQRYPNP